MIEVDGYRFKDQSDDHWFFPDAAHLPAMAAALRTAGILPAEFNAATSTPPEPNSMGLKPESVYWFEPDEHGILRASRAHPSPQGL